MSVSFTGPVLNRRGSANSPRGGYGGAPVSFEPDYVEFFEDFYGTLDTNIWDASVKDAGATVAIGADTKNGRLLITSTATTDNDGGSLQTTEEFINLNTDTWFVARFQTNDATQTDIFVGLSETFATNPEAVLAAYRIGFQKNDGDTNLLFITENASGTANFDTGYDLVAATDVKVAFRVQNGEALVYVNDNYVGRFSTYVPTTNLAVALFQLSGVATGTKIFSADYVGVASARV